VPGTADAFNAAIPMRHTKLFIVAHLMLVAIAVFGSS
jgi:hypothetical protein